MASNDSNGGTKYYDLVAFVKRDTANGARTFPMVIGQTWRANSGKTVFRLDALPVSGWDGSGVVEDHEERVRRAREAREQGGGEDPLP